MTNAKGNFCNMKCLALAAAVVTAPFLAIAQGSNTPTNLDYFKLWNKCAPTELVVESLSSKAIEIGLSIERIETLARSRLRAARIYSDWSSETYLYVRVTVGSTYYGLDIQFKKILFDALSSEKADGQGFATTWDRGSAGSHGQDAGYIVQHVSEHIDEFIDEYLRVNAEAC